MDNIVEGQFHDVGLMFVTPAKFEELYSYLAKNDDILISRAGTVGKMAVVQSTAERAIIHSNLIRLRFDPTKVLPVYFATMMNHFAERVGKLKRGQEEAYTFMSTHGLAQLTIPLPPLGLQKRFAAAVDEQVRLRRTHEEALRQAEHLFQTLLHRAFTTGL